VLIAAFTRPSEQLFLEITIVLDQITFVLSSLTLAIVLFELLVIHAAQIAPKVE